jgi:hypothetical protein
MFHKGMPFFCAEEKVAHWFAKEISFHDEVSVFALTKTETKHKLFLGICKSCLSKKEIWKEGARWK